MTSNWNATQFYSYDYLDDRWKELTVFPDTGSERLDATWVQIGRTPTGPVVFNGAGSYTKHETWLYDAAGDTWSRRMDSSVCGRAPPVIQDDAKIYSIFGATVQRGQLAAYDIASDQWSMLAPPPFTSGVLTGVVISNRRIYGLGSSDPDLLYDISANTWSSAPSSPGTNGLPIGVFDGVSRLYKIGALCGTTPCPKDMWVLDTTTLTWSQGPSLPAPWVVYTPAIFGCDGDLYFFTGPEHDQPMTAEPAQYTLRFDPKTQAWDSSL